MSQDVIGAKVRTRQGEDIGIIKELLVDPESGRISYAILAYGGLMGLGEKLFAFPWEALTQRPEVQVFVLNVDREQLENAPGLNRDEWPIRSSWEHSKSLMPYRED